MTLAATILSFASHPSPSPLGEGRGEGHLAIVTDRRLSAAALTALFLRDRKYRLIGEARGVDDVRQLLGTFRPSVTILDASWVAGRPPLDVTRCDGSGRLLVILDPADGPDVLLTAMEVDANGYVSRAASRETLEAALCSLESSGWFMDPLLVGPVMLALRQRAGAGRSQPLLSQREDDILVRIASGRSTKEIAREYAIAPKTVSNHVNNIYRKLNLTHRGQLVLYAAQQGLSLS